MRLIETGVIDTETIQSIFDAASGIFKQFPDIEPSKTALRLIEPFDPAKHDFKDPHISRFGAVNDYEGLAAEVRDRTEHALLELRMQKQRGENIDAVEVFTALATVVETRHTPRAPIEAIGSNRTVTRHA